MQLCINQSCRLSSEHSSSVPRPISRKDVEAPDVNKKAAPDLFGMLPALCLSVSHSNCVAARAVLPPRSRGWAR